MAFETGTATGLQDLHDKLLSFLTTNADLVAASQAWEVVWEAPDHPDADPTDKIIRGPGLSGEDQVYIGIRLGQNTPEDAYWIQFRGMTGVIPSGITYVDHINVQPDYVRMFADSGTFQYWFVANGRRFMVVLKISTVFEAMYAGLFLPYATPLSYQYPLFVGGSASTAEGSPVNWRSEELSHTHFTAPYYDSGSTPEDPVAWVLGADGSWLVVANDGSNGDATLHPPTTRGDYWTTADNSNGQYNRIDLVRGLMDCYGGDRLLTPFTLLQQNPDTQTLGILDGAYKCQGVANAAENVITEAGVDHLVVQNVYRSNFNDYWAMGLE